MAITQVGAAVVPAGNPTTGFTCAIGSGVATNDILIISITNRDATTDPTVVDNDTGGNAWAKLGGGATGLSVWWKRATSATASKTVTVGACVGSSSGVLTAWRGVTTAAVPYESVTTESNGSGDVSHAAVTTSRDLAWVFLCIANRTNDIAAATQAATSPAVITELGESLSTGGSDCSNTQCAAEKATAGSSGTISWVQTAAVTVSCAFALIPAPAALTISAGAYAYAGGAVGLVASRRLTVVAGSYAYAGNNVVMARQFRLSVVAGAYAYSGASVAMVATRRLAVAAGGYAYSGSPVGLIASRRLTVDGGAVAYVGHDVEFTYASGGPPPVVGRSLSLSMRIGM